MNTILITGVGQRVGFFLAENLIEQGYKVIGTYRTDRPSLDELRSIGVTLYQSNFYQNDSVTQLIDSIQSEHTGLRAIIHNASDWISDSSDDIDIVEKMMKVHVNAPYRINRSLAHLLNTDSSKYSDIIHFSDYVASTGSDKNSAYAASKAALENLTLSMAKQWAPNIKVNAIAPALIKFNIDDSDQYRVKTLKKSLIPREGGYEEVFNAVLFLLNSRYITGRILPLDGGRHLVR